VGWGDLMFRFEGRIGRARFWTGYVYVIVILIVVTAYGLANRSAQGYAVFAVGYVVTFWSSLALYVKRFHDRDKSGWWAVIGLVPVIGPIWMTIEHGFLPGTRGPNQYGADPLAS